MRIGAARPDDFEINVISLIDVMLTLRACERRGIKTTLVTYEYGGKDGVDSPLLYYVPEANALTATRLKTARW